MASQRETQERHANDVVNGNMTGLMGDFTPNAMTKVMAIASNPIKANSFEINEVGTDEVEISYINDTGRRVIWSRWIDNGGTWQIDDVEERQTQ